MATRTFSDDEFEFYRSPGPFTVLSKDDAAEAREVIAGGSDIATLVQGLVLHEAHAALYGVRIPEYRRRREMQIRPAASLLARVRELDPAPLREARSPERRLVGYCRHFSVLSVAMLRAAGIPARVRCGFFCDIRSGRFLDHWVIEKWHGDRWIRVDTQLDAAQRMALGLDFDPNDVPANRFVSGSEAWLLCRGEQADPAQFGIAEWWGAWFVRNNVIRDLAALNKSEWLPWDSWGVMDRASALGRHPADRVIDEAASAVTADNWPLIQRFYERADFHPADPAAA